MKSKWVGVSLPDLRTSMKVQRWFFTIGPNSKRVANSLCCSDLHWREGWGREGSYFVALHTWTVVGWRRSAMAEKPKGREYKFLFVCLFVFWELMHICCGLQKSLCHYEESSSRTDLGWANYTPWRKRWETKVWTDCYNQRVWMFVCFVHVRYSTEQSYEDIPYPTSVRIDLSWFAEGLGSKNIDLLRKEHYFKKKMASTTIQESTGPQSRCTKHCFGLIANISLIYLIFSDSVKGREKQGPVYFLPWANHFQV